MPTREEALAELYARGKLTEPQKMAYEELTRRGSLILPKGNQNEPKSGGVTGDLPSIRNESMAELAKEIGPLQAFLIGTGKGFYNVGRGLGIADPADQTEKETMAGLKEKRPYSTGAGEIVGESAPFLVPGMGASGIASVPLRIAASGVLGGVEGGVLSKGVGSNVAAGVGMGTGIAVGAEILFPVLGRLGRKILQRIKGDVPVGAVLDAVGKPTPELKEALDAVGMTFDDLTDDAVELITKQKPGAKTEQVARAALFTEAGVPATRGEITKGYKQLATEQRLIESVQDTAAEPLRQFKLKQSEAIKTNLKANLGESGKEETGELIHDALMGRKKLLRTQKNELYGASAGSATEIGGVHIFIDNLKESIPDADLFEDLAITAPQGMKSLDQILTKYGIKEPTMEMFDKGFKPTPLTVENFERFRKTLNAIERGDTTGAVSVATRPIKEALDKELAEIGTVMADQGVPDSVVKPLVEARKVVRKLKTEFSPQSIMGRIIDTKKDGVTQVIEASKVYDKLIGRASPVEHTRRLIKSLSQSGEKGKQAIASLQATTIMDLIDAGFGTESRKISGVKTFNPIAFKNRLKAIGPDKMKSLFVNEKQVLKKLNNIEKIAGELVPPSGAVPKGSASVIMDLANTLGLAGISTKIPGGALLIGALKALGDPVKKGAAVKKALKAVPETEPVRLMIEHQFAGIASALGIAVKIKEKKK